MNSGASENSKVKLLHEPYKGESNTDFSNRIVNFVWRTKNDVLLRDALNDQQFGCDSYIKEKKPLSIACVIIRYKNKHCGVIYLENNLNFGTFSDERLKLLNILISQFMISFENSALVSTLKQTNHELKKKNEQLKELDKLKDSFLAINNHELRTPLNGIIGLTTLLEETHLDQEQKEYMQDIKSCSESLLKITNDILYLSKLKAMKVTLEKRIFCLSECLETCLKVIEFPALQKGLSLNYLVDKNVPQFLIGDYLRLRQIILNLFNNAIKFTEKGEVVVLVSLKSRKKINHANQQGIIAYNDYDLDDYDDDDLDRSTVRKTVNSPQVKHHPSKLEKSNSLDSGGMTAAQRIREHLNKIESSKHAFTGETRANSAVGVTERIVSEGGIRDQEQERIYTEKEIEEEIKRGDIVELHFEIRDTGKTSS